MPEQEIFHEERGDESWMDEWAAEVRANCSCTWPAGEERNKYAVTPLNPALTTCTWHAALQKEATERARWRLQRLWFESRLQMVKMYAGVSEKRAEIIREIRAYMESGREGGYLAVHPEIAAEVAALLA